MKNKMSRHKRIKRNVVNDDRVAKYIAQGLPLKQIAKKVGIRSSTLSQQLIRAGVKKKGERMKSVKRRMERWK